MKCAYCNHENPEGETFCSKCGMKLEGAAPAAPPPAAPVQQPPAPAPAPPAQPKGVRCENCGVLNPEGASVCKSCNKPLVQPTAPPPAAPVAASPSVCPSCGFDKNPSTAKFCMSCGKQLTPTPAPPAAAPPAAAPPPAPPVSYPVAKLVLPDMKEIPISGHEEKIGREDLLRVASPEDTKFVSREHLKITYENGRYYIVDEGSTNGTKLNGVEIKGQGKRELNTNDEIVLADTVTVRFQM